MKKTDNRTLTRVGANDGIAVEPAALTATWRDYLSLTKPEITFLVTISAAAGFVLGSPASIDVAAFCWALIGIPLVSAGGAALNHWAERDMDATMRRTANRPLPAGRISSAKARLFGVVLSGAGIGLLCPLTNPLTGVLAGLALLLYVLVYTPLKRRTSWNTVIGALPGALPALGGYTAASGSLGTGGWIIFAILFLWQLPHFMALAWMYRNDYSRAGYAMWSVDDEGGARTSGIMVSTSLLLLIASLLPVPFGISGIAYGAGALILAGWFLAPVLRFSRSRSVTDARRVLKTTVYYIPLLLLLIIADRLVA